MRITLIGPLPPPHGGIASHVARMRAHLEAKGLDVRVLSPFGSSRPGHVKTHISCLPFSLLRGARRDLRHWHLTGWHRLLVMGLCERFLPGKSFYTLHVDLERVGPSDAWLRWMLKPVDRVICVKEEDQLRMVRRGLHGQVRTIPAYLPARDTTAEEPELCAWLRSRQPALLFMASHWGLTGGQATYGLDLLLEALAGMASRPPRLGLLALVPQDALPEEQHAALRPALESLGDAVRLVTRPLPLEAVLPAAKLLVRPTRTDGDALSLREAEALGIEVLASDCAPRRPHCHLFRSGSVDSLREALETLLREPAPRIARDDAPREDFAQELLREYQRVAGDA